MIMLEEGNKEIGHELEHRKLEHRKQRSGHGNVDRGYWGRARTCVLKIGCHFVTVMQLSNKKQQHFSSRKPCGSKVNALT